jgi:beta-N-acetylhexosaminidase
VDLSIEELRQRELKPFQALIDDGIAMIMTAHILFPKIDSDNTATLSKIILNDLLREEMGFKGIVIADALGMGAIAKNISEKESIVKAVNAGLDIFLAAGDNIDLSHAIRMAELIAEGLKSGDITEQTLQKSTKRIDTFTTNLPQYNVTSLAETVFREHHVLADKIASLSKEQKFELNLPGFE